MFDAAARRLIDPILARLGRRMARAGASADMVTLAGLAAGLMAAALVALGQPLAALVGLLLSRLLDGLDGAVASATRRTEFGGYLDICCDFLTWGALAFGFVLLDPGANGVAGAFLLASFYFNGSTFLGYAILVARRGGALRPPAAGLGPKAFHYAEGLLEGTETIAFFALLCLVPGLFVPLGWAFGALCFVTGALRLIGAARLYRAGGRA